MSSPDKYPQNIEFEIDRPRLTKYWQLQSLAGYCSATLLAGLFAAGALIGDRFKASATASAGQYVLAGLEFLLLTLAVTVALGVLLYFALGHYQSKWAAANLRLLVEGQYLRLVTGAVFITDRRIHFRAISDYSTHDGPLLRRLGIKTLAFRVIGGNQPSRTTIPGVIDALKVRDMLCEIDAAREN